MATVHGNDKNNTITGTSGGDSLFGNGGNDTISGGGSTDYLMGGSGVDKLYGGDGNDKMNLTTGAVNYSHTNTTRELLDGGKGIDNAHIDASGSTVDGLPTQVVNIGATGNGNYSVTLNSNSGFGSAYIANTAGVESFTFKADGPAVSFTGNVGGVGPSLTVSTTDKDDIFCGGGENSTVNLLGGNDKAVVSGGADTFTLGAGADTVEFTALYNGARSGVVTDFNPNEDVINLEGWGETLAITEDAGGTWLKGGDDSLYLMGVHGYDSPMDFIA